MGWHGAAAFVDQWLQNFVCTALIGGTVQLIYAAIGRRPVPVPRPLAHGLVMLVGTAVGAELAARVLATAWGFPVHEVRWTLLRIGFVVTVLTVGFVLLVDRLRAQIHAAELREEHAQRAALQAELRAVQARTQPHFLLNALNVVSALVQEDPPRAEAVLGHLASLFQYAIQAGSRTTVPLREEVDAVLDTLAVEGARYGDRLSFTLEVLVPPLVLQPLVENAVQHGIASRAGPGTVAISARLAGQELRLEVVDDGVGLGRSPRSGNGAGLTDLRERLRLLYGDRAALAVASGERGTVATVTLPVGEP